MPGIDRVEVCRRLKAQGLTRDIPVIFSTAKNEIEAEQRGLDLGRWRATCEQQRQQPRACEAPLQRTRQSGRNLRAARQAAVKMWLRLPNRPPITPQKRVIAHEAGDRPFDPRN